MIIYLVFRRQRWGQLYHRIMLGLSLTDILATLGILFQPLLKPRYTNHLFAVGNTSTCEAVGFIFQFYFASVVYTAELALYFLLFVKGGRTPRRISNLLEPYIHVAPPVIALLFGSIALSLRLFNPDYLLYVCEVETFPSGCLLQQDPPCERGRHAHSFYLVRQVLTAIFAVGGFVTTWCVYATVRRQTMRTSARALGSQHVKRMKAVATQAVLYSLAFANSFVWIVIAGSAQDWCVDRLLHHNGSRAPCLFCIITVYLFLPLQGFLNALIYIRPQYQQWRESGQDRSRALKHAISGRSFVASGLASRRSIVQDSSLDMSDLDEHRMTVNNNESDTSMDITNSGTGG